MNAAEGVTGWFHDSTMVTIFLLCFFCLFCSWNLRLNFFYGKNVLVSYLTKYPIKSKDEALLGNGKPKHQAKQLSSNNLALIKVRTLT